LEKTFDIGDFTAEKTTERIRELRRHLHEELLPGSRGHLQGGFITPFVEYLDRQAERFEASLGGPLDVTAWRTRNLLEFWSLMTQVFVNQESRAYFFGEMFVDGDEIRSRLEKLGIPRHQMNDEPPAWDWVPDKRLTVLKNRYDDYVFKLCSKYIHPSATWIFAREAMPGPFIFHFSGLGYLNRSYNFVIDRVFKSIDAPEP
jgi:hypothetical protein